MKYYISYSINVDGYLPVAVPDDRLQLMASVEITKEQYERIQALPGGYVPCAAVRDKFPTTRDEEANIGAYIDAYLGQRI